jgi:membrane-associated phospholipid phosphatase
MGALIAGSRVALGQHYVSDVVAGAVLGRSIGRMVVARAAGEAPVPTHSWTPIVGPDNRGYGVAYTRNW